MTYPWPTLMPMGIVVISCVRPSVQPSMGLGLCIAYKALGRNGLQFGMLMYPDDLHSAFMDAYGYCCWSVCPSIFRWLCICWQITWNKWHKIWHADVSPSLISLSHIDAKGYSCHVMQILSACPTIWVFFSKVRVGAKEGGSHYWEMAVAITCGYGGYLLPLLAAHSSYLLAYLSQ